MHGSKVSIHPLPENTTAHKTGHGVQEITICTPGNEEVSGGNGDVRDDVPVHITLLVPAEGNRRHS